MVDAQPASDEARRWPHGIRLGGTHVPGVLAAGRFYSHGELVFWDVHDPDKAIAIRLSDERYNRLVLEVDDPQSEINRIRHAARASAA